MKILNLIFISLVAWLAGLIGILLVSYFSFETPGVQDALGFGGLLFFASLLVIPLLYIPALLVLRRMRPETSRLTIMLTLAALANLPVYILIATQSGSRMGTGEALLFIIGFIIVALVFGMGYPKASKQYRNETV